MKKHTMATHYTSKIAAKNLSTGMRIKSPLARHGFKSITYLGLKGKTLVEISYRTEGKVWFFCKKLETRVVIETYPFFNSLMKRLKNLGCP